MIESIEQLLQIQDDKGRVAIPSNIRKLLNISNDSIIKLKYIKTENEKIKTLLPYSEENTLNKHYRFQTSKKTREYLNLERKDYFVAEISKCSENKEQ